MTFNQHVAYIERAQVSDLHITTYYVLNDPLNPCEYTLVFLLIMKVSIFLRNSFLYQKRKCWSVFYDFVKRQLPPPPLPRSLLRISSQFDIRNVAFLRMSNS